MRMRTRKAGDAIPSLLERARVDRTARQGPYFVIRNGLYDDAPETYRLYRATTNGYKLLLVVSRSDRPVLDNRAAEPDEQAAVAAALAHLGVSPS